MSSTPTSSSSFQPIFDAALSDYAKKTGIDLATHPFAQTLQDCQSADAILELLQDRSKQFSTYRDGNRKLIDCLKPVVQILHTFSGLLAGAAALVSPRVSNTFNPTLIQLF
jgi:fungal STAND N-terminal Goodbye domain